MENKFDLIVVGTGFASSFFLLSYLQQAKPNARVLVLERGRFDTHRWQVENTRTTSQNANATFVNQNPDKAWVYNPGFGGGSNCWWAVTPRLLPNDFQMQTKYGVGIDWPLSYADLEPFYTEAEEIMQISGPQDHYPFPKSSPYPQPPHRFSDVDKAFKAAYPDLYFHQPTARARVNTQNRSRCCATGVCTLCPVNAKFTIQNELHSLYQDPRVILQLEATAQSIETQGGIAIGVNYILGDKTLHASGELIVLGANAIFNPHILQRSNILHPMLGKRLHEQTSVEMVADLDGLNNFQGSTSVTGHGYMLYDSEDRRDFAAILIENFNIPKIRTEQGKWQQRLHLKFIFEVLPSEENYVKFHDNTPDIPELIHTGYSDYTLKSIERLPSLFPDLLAPLPIEHIYPLLPLNRTESHILGTTLMGNDPEFSIIDKHLIHHDIRNLLVLGGGAFPTSSPSNPTLTISALSLWAANHLMN